MAGHLTPIRAFPARDGLELTEIDITGVSGALPFQADQIEAARALGRPIVSTRIGLAELDRGEAPSGLILHCGRAGSTLLSRALAMLGMCRIASEPVAINDLLGSDSLWRALPWAARERGLIHVADRLRRASGAAPLPFVLKLSSWNAVEAARIERIWPGTPKVYLYREPGDALASLAAAPPGWARHAEKPESAGLVAFLARTMADGMSAVADLLEPNSGDSWLLVDHAELPEAITGRIARHLGLDVPHDANERIASLARIDAKDPGGTRPFSPSCPERTPAIVELAESLLREPYRRLEALRPAQTGS